MSDTAAVMEFLLSRRSRPAKILKAPAPDAAELDVLLTAAARVPDHGKLEPWRFVVLEAPACARMAQAIENRGNALGMEPEKRDKAALTFAESPLVVAVIASPKPSEKIPEIEQTLSAGAVCLSLVNAALGAGWGACWLSGWPAYDAEIQAELGLAAQEWIAGFVHIGTASAIPPERPRPEISTLTTRFQT